MSATPQTIEEALQSLQKILDHPRSLPALRREMTLRVKVIGDARIHDINSFYIGPIRSMRPAQLALIVFAENDIADAKLRFGVWNWQTKRVQPLLTSEVSDDLSSLQHIVQVLTQKAVGSYQPPDVPRAIKHGLK